MSEYTFLKTRYENAPLLISPDGKYVRRRTVGSTARIVYLDQPLDFNDKLVLRVEATSDNSGVPFSFVFGVTTCDKAAVNKYECHAASPCSTNSPCCGSSITFNVTSCERIGYFAYFERLSTTFIMVTIGKKSFPMYDLGGVFDGRKAYPFVMLTGSVGALRIISESELPQLSPIGSRRMSRPEVRFRDHSQGRLFPRSGRDRSASAPNGEWRSTAATNAQGNGRPSSIQLLSPEHIVQQLGALSIPTQWVSNDSVTHVLHQNAESLKRTLSPNHKNYTFRQDPFDIDKSITFKIEQVDDFPSATLTFGATRNNPKEINFNGLPLDPKDMTTGAFIMNYFLKPNVIPVPAVIGTCVNLRRTMSGIMMRTSDNFEDQVVIEVDPTITLYPFFCFNGSVKEISFLKEFKIRKRLAMECCACLDTNACHFCLPCKHLVFCEECLSHAKLSASAASCPVCRSPVKEYDRIYL